MIRKLSATACLAVLLAHAPRATAGTPDPKRTIAVLEFRGGSSALPGLAARAAEILRTRTSLQVLDADEAHLAYGDKLDTHLAACAGDSECIARIGRKLEVSEVLLLGVSEFGDVIVTLQRIDVAGGEVSARVAEALAPDRAPDDGALIGYLRRVLPRSDFVRYGTIEVTAAQRGAAVYVAEKRRGTTPLAPLKVRAPASYKIRVVKPGYTPFNATVDVPPDAVVTVEPVLTRSQKAWYQHWWVPAVAGVVVVGVVGTAIIATDNDPTEVASTIRW